MKKDELINALHEVRTGLKSDSIVERFLQAWDAGVSPDQGDFANNIMALLVAGTGNFTRFTDAAHEVCDRLKISPFYAAQSNSEIIHHLAKAKDARPVEKTAGSTYRTQYLSQPLTIFFFEAHQRVATISDLLDHTLHVERPDGELLLEGINAEGGPSLDRV